ncbi:laccase-23-like [Panicum miliaceum]|uniref:Laccase-23-like n=1 Tax=Panicum miliaceum TaxID=4540 RepID=A0A3L6TQP6_PANMI|nr:laccase-23-like [Panicum miliaceum]
MSVARSGYLAARAVHQATKVHKLKVRRHRAPWTRPPSHQRLRLREPPHPLIIHIHGYDFYIVAEGLGNFNAATDTPCSTFEDLLMRNTVGVPVSGWVVIRFVADNPGGVADALPSGHAHHLGTRHGVHRFMVEDDVEELQSLEAPSPDLPQSHSAERLRALTLADSSLWPFVCLPDADYLEYSCTDSHLLPSQTSCLH